MRTTRTRTSSASTTNSRATPRAPTRPRHITQVNYDTHFRRYQLGTNKEAALKEFHKSPKYAELCQAHAKARRQGCCD